MIVPSLLIASPNKLNVNSEIQTGDCEYSNGIGYLIKVKSSLGTRNIQSIMENAAVVMPCEVTIRSENLGQIIIAQHFVCFGS